MENELAQRVIDVIAKTQHIEATKITADSSFEELGIDSLDGINILFALEGEFNISIPDEAARTIRTVREMIDGVQKLVDGANAEATA